MLGPVFEPGLGLAALLVWLLGSCQGPSAALAWEVRPPGAPPLSVAVPVGRRLLCPPVVGLGELRGLLGFLPLPLGQAFPPVYGKGVGW